MLSETLENAFVTSESLDRVGTLVDYTESLREYGLASTDVIREPVILEAGQSITLDGQQPSELLCRRLKTDDLDEFKRWIGVSNERIENGHASPPGELPVNPWHPGLEGPRGSLSQAELHDIALAANYYLFGDSLRVARYEGAILRHFAPFEAVLYAAEELEILPGATLSVRGYPAVFILDRLTIHEGGSLKLHTVTRMMVDTLRKLSS